MNALPPDVHAVLCLSETKDGYTTPINYTTPVYEWRPIPDPNPAFFDLLKGWQHVLAAQPSQTPSR